MSEQNARGLQKLLLASGLMLISEIKWGGMKILHFFQVALTQLDFVDTSSVDTIRF